MWKVFGSCIIREGLEQRSPLWEAERYLRLSGSVLEQAFGLSRFGTREELLSGKKKEVNEHMQRGIDSEPILRKWYRDRTGYRTEEIGLLLTTRTYGSNIFEKYGSQGENSRHPNWFLAGSPDDFVYTPEGVKLLEIKAPKDLYASLEAQLKKREVISRLAPDGKSIDHYGHIYRSHYWQMQFYLGLSGISSCDYLVGGPDFFYLENIPFDATYWRNYLYPACVEFVEDYLHPQLDTVKGKEKLKQIDEVRTSLPKDIYTVV